MDMENNMTDTVFWDKVAPKYATDPISDMPAYEETLGRMRAHLQPDHAVLEIGCGTGSTALELTAGVKSYLGTDISPQMIRIARTKLTRDAPGDLAFDVATAGHPPEGHYDAVLALNLLHLVPDMDEVLRSVYRLLPKGGLFIAKTALLKDGNRLVPLVIPLMRLLGKAPSVLSLSRHTVERQLRAAGFVGVETIRQPGLVPRLFTVYRKP